MKKSSKIILASVMVLGITGGAFAFGAHHFANMSVADKAEMINDRVASKLELNDLQKQKFATMSSRVAEIIQQQKSQHEGKQMMGQLINEQPLDQQFLLNKIQNKTSLVNQHAPEIVALLANFVDSLDAEQKEEIQEMMQKRHSRHGSMH